jgi:phage-related baseplate assembly protein
VVLTSPAADMVVASTHAAFCTSITLTDGGRDV